MSDKNDINRRKVLSTAAGASAALVGGPAVAAAKNQNGEAELTEEELEAALNAATTQVRTSSSSASGLHSGTELPALSNTDGPDVFVGAESNAEIPGAKPFAIETNEEFLQRDVPLHVANASGVQQVMIPDFYRQVEIGEFSVAGYDVEVAVGAGLKWTYVPPKDVSISLSLDISLDIAGYGTFTITPAGMNFGISKNSGKETYCIDTGINPSNLPGIDLEFCGNVKAKTDGDEIKFELTFSIGDVCADIRFTELCVNPPLSVGVDTPSYELPV